jgi:hypothetical protein
MLHFNNNLETLGLLCGLKSTVSVSEEKRDHEMFLHEVEII